MYWPAFSENLDSTLETHLDSKYAQVTDIV